MSVQDFIGHLAPNDMGGCILLGFTGNREVYLTKHFSISSFAWWAAGEEDLEKLIRIQYTGSKIAPNIQIGGGNV